MCNTYALQEFTVDSTSLHAVATYILLFSLAYYMEQGLLP